MRVCHVTNSLTDASIIADIAAEQADDERFDDVGVLAWFDADETVAEKDYELSCLNVPSGSFRLTRPQYARAKEILAGYDLVHTHHNHSGFYAKMVARRLGKPIVVTDHNNHRGFTLKGRVAEAVTNVFADEVVCVSESVYDSYAWWERVFARRSKVSVVNNGVDIERLENANSLDWNLRDAAEVDSDAVVVGSAGMLTEQKAHDVLVEAVDRANAESDVPVELVISGDGDLRDELEEQIAGCDHPDRLHLLGFLERKEHVYKMMHEVDVYAMPSRWEGFCVAALEAMGVGNPCVFSDIDEFVRPFEDVARFHPVDDADALSRELLRLVNSAEEREELKKRAKELVEAEYTISDCAEGYFEVYGRLTG
ncbi:MAG: glycosyltransferase family 4 protein [Halobacteriales archaeon]|nr:glycosyltransferase family 4 protein [Halobacteriales archaeon]